MVPALLFHNVSCTKPTLFSGLECDSQFDLARVALPVGKPVAVQATNGNTTCNKTAPTVANDVVEDCCLAHPVRGVAKTRLVEATYRRN